MTGLSPLDIILLTFIGGGIVAVWRFMLRESKESTTATNNNTSVMTQVNETMKKSVEMMGENIKVMEKFKDEVLTNVNRVTKRK